jgi:hypothetical protein
MSPNTPEEVKWDPEALREGAKVISSVAPRIDGLAESKTFLWRDPSVKPSDSDLGTDPRDQPAPHEVFIAQDLYIPLHNMVWKLKDALKNLALQAEYGSDGLDRMADSYAAVEDANLAAAYGIIEKTLNPNER